MAKTQLDALLTHFVQHGSLTTFEAYERYGCTRLAARVLELSRKGYRFRKEPLPVTTRYGANITVTKYILLDRRDHLTGKFVPGVTG